MKKSFKLILIFVVSVFMYTLAWGQEGSVYYCNEMQNTGFLYNEISKSYSPAQFKESKFLFNLNTNRTEMLLSHSRFPDYPNPTKFDCPLHNDTVLFCSVGFHSIFFNFNKKSQGGWNFTLTHTSGHITAENSEILISIGSCVAFKQ